MRKRGRLVLKDMGKPMYEWFDVSGLYRLLSTPIEFVYNPKNRTLSEVFAKDNMVVLHSRGIPFDEAKTVVAKILEYFKRNDEYGLRQGA